MALSQQEFEKLKAQLSAKKSKFAIPEPKQPGFLSRVGSDLSKRVSNVKEIFSDAKEDNGVASGFFRPLESGIRAVGQVAGGVGDVIGQAGVSGFRALPDSIENPIRQVGRDVMQTGAGETIGQAAQKYENWAQKNPRAAKDLEGIVNIASLLPVGKGAQVAGKGAVAGTKAVGRGAVRAGEGVADLGRLGMTKAADVVSPIERGVQTVLTNSTELPKQADVISKLSKYTDQAQKAITDYSEITPMEIAGREGESALKNLQNQLKAVGTQKKTVTKSIGDTPVGEIVNDSRKTIRTELRERAGMTFTKDGEIRNAKGRISTISDPADLKLLKDVDTLLTRVAQKPTFQRVDDAVDYMQDLLFKRQGLTAIPVNKNVEGIIKKAVKELNDNLKEIGGKEYRALNTKYSNRKRVFDNLNKALGVEGNKGAALMKQLFSPNGTASRKLFKAIKDYTGVDLVQEATLAKFAMENIGDVRQASLLEQVLKGNATSKQGLIGIAADKVLNKIQDPIGKAKRIAEKRKNQLK